jgi:hypothetical protein
MSQTHNQYLNEHPVNAIKDVCVTNKWSWILHVDGRMLLKATLQSHVEVLSV